MNFFGALWKFVTFQWLFSGWKVNEAADNMWTKSPETIAAAFDHERDRMVTWINKFEEAYSRVAAGLEGDKIELHESNDREQKLIGRRDECVRQFNAAKAAGNTARITELETLFGEIDGEIQKIEDRQKELEESIKLQEQTVADLQRDYLEFQSKLDQLPREKAQAIATFVRSKARIDLSKELRGLKTSLESGPLDAVRKRNKELTAQANAASTLDGSRLDRKMADLDVAARQTTSRSRLEQMAAAQTATSAVKTGEAPAPAAAEGERTKI